jgi:hypothetical protein
MDYLDRTLVGIGGYVYSFVYSKVWDVVPGYRGDWWLFIDDVMADTID